MQNDLSFDDVEIIYRENIANIGKYGIKISSYDQGGYNLLINKEIPPFDNSSIYSRDDFAAYFAALCALFYKLFIDLLLEDKFTKFSAEMQKLKERIIKCLKIAVSDKQSYIEDLDYVVNKLLNCSKKTHNRHNQWHKKKETALKNFIENFNCSDDDFPFILYCHIKILSSIFKSPVYEILQKGFEYKWIALFCAYQDNMTFLFQNINNFVLRKFLRYKEKSSASGNFRLVANKNDWMDWGPKEFPTIFNKLEDIIRILDLKELTTKQRAIYHHGKKSLRERYGISLEAIGHLLKYCYEKPAYAFHDSILDNNKLLGCLTIVQGLPQDIQEKYPSVSFLFYWSIHSLNYSEFKSLFLEKKNQPQEFSDLEDGQRYTKISEYKELQKIDFLSYGKDGKTLLLQKIFFFAVADMQKNPHEGHLFDNQVSLLVKEALQDGCWCNPAKQKEIFNKILETSDIVPFEGSLNYKELGEYGFSRTETAVNLIFNIAQYACDNNTNGIVQQINHIDELKDRRFKYHNENYNNATDDEKTLFKEESQMMQSIDDGFLLKNFCQTFPTRQHESHTRDMVCKLFKETDVSSVPIGNDYDRYRTLHRSMLSTVYLYSARNMTVHYAEFSQTKKLLDEKNCRDLLKILFDLKERIEIDIKSGRFARKYKNYYFTHKSKFPANDTEDDIIPFLEKLWKFIQKHKAPFLKAISEDPKIASWEINGMILGEMLYRKKTEIPVYRELNEELDKSESNISINRKINKKDIDFIEKCLDTLVNRKDELYDFISKAWREREFKNIKDVFDRVSWLYGNVYARCMGEHDKNQDARRKIETEIHSWDSFFEWKSIEQDLLDISDKLGKIDYLGKGFKKIVALDVLQDEAKQGKFDLLTQELHDIAENVSSHILFKNLYENIHDESDLIGFQSEDLSYYWDGHFIEKCFEMKDEEALMDNLKFIEHKVLTNEILWPYDAELKKKFIEYLSGIDTRVEETFNDESLFSLARKISKEASKIISTWGDRTADERSLNVFKDDYTYGLAIMEKCKTLLLQTICYVTASDMAKNKLKTADKELLKEDGSLTIRLSYNFKNPDAQSNQLFNEIKYTDKFKEDLRIFLDYIFGITNVYDQANESHGGTLFDIYGYKIFLYLIKVTFAMNQKTKTGN